MIRNMKILIGGLVLSQGVFAQINPCVTIGQPFSIYNNTDVMCGAMYPDQVRTALASQTVIELRTLITEIRGLRQEMKAYEQSLAQARENFDATSKETVAAQERWRKDALSQTLTDIAAVPSRLGANEALRGALLSMLREELPKDPVFLEAVQTALKK